MTEFDEIRRMLDLMDEHGLEEFELERDGVRVRLRKRATREGAPRRADSAAEIAPAEPGDAVDRAVGESADAEGLVFVKSPIVGMFFRAPDPDADPFVDVGSVVQKGQTLCIIEAMKLMNEIDAEVDGQIATVFVETGQPVQYGDRLFAIRPT